MSRSRRSLTRLRRLEERRALEVRAVTAERRVAELEAQLEHQEASFRTFKTEVRYPSASHFLTRFQSFGSLLHCSVRKSAATQSCKMHGLRLVYYVLASLT
jgi:methylphosphotriester-DNA--protein-cysteine methyltransferase